MDRPDFTYTPRSLATLMFRQSNIFGGTSWDADKLYKMLVDGKCDGTIVEFDMYQTVVDQRTGNVRMDESSRAPCAVDAKELICFWVRPVFKPSGLEIASTMPPNIPKFEH